MIANYFKTAFRNLWNNKFYSFLNMTGLSIGLAVGIMVLLWVRHEQGYDRFHRHAADIYKINSHIGKGEGSQVWEGAPAPLSVFSKQIPGIEKVTRINAITEPLLFSYGDKKIKENRTAFVDASFFSLFDFGLLEGNRTNPLPDPQSIIMTRSAARKYFGDSAALGKIIAIKEYGDFKVSGIIADFPANSSLQYDILLSMNLYADMFAKWGGNGEWKTIDEDLGNYSYLTYMQLSPKADPGVVARQLTTVFQEKKGQDARDNSFTLQPLSSLHLVAANGSTRAQDTVRIFLIVAILVLCIACINYVNLSTARSMLRAKEVSVRKIIGAGRVQLFMQFIAESALLFLFASILAFLLIYLLLPLYNQLSGKSLLFSLTDQSVWLVIAAAISGSLAIASIYPAFLLSSFKPLEALRGKMSAGIGHAGFRKGLVITQFVFSTALIISTIIISSQLNYVKRKDLGFDKEQVLTFALTKEMNEKYETVKTEILKQPGVIGVAASGNNLVGNDASTSDTDWDGKEESRVFLVRPNAVDHAFIPLLKMKLVAGSNFSGTSADSSHYILNETAVRQAGIKDPIGKPFSLWGSKGIITGVVKDFNFASLKQVIEPTVFMYRPWYWRMYIKTTGQDAARVISSVHHIWKNYTADFPFEYTFLDDDFNRLYQDDKQTSRLFAVFAAIAILISCLGLFGLATYTAQVKIKEIGIRKVLGASTAGITALLAKDFIRLVIVAIIIASPLSWIAMNKWLENYAYRIDIGWWVFALTGLLAVGIAMLTVSFQSIRAAMRNPVRSLRSE